jgi:hypothetical protein
MGYGFGSGVLLIMGGVAPYSISPAKAIPPKNAAAASICRRAQSPLKRSANGALASDRDSGDTLAHHGAV